MALGQTVLEKKKKIYMSVLKMGVRHQLNLLNIFFKPKKEIFNKRKHKDTREIQIITSASL